MHYYKFDISAWGLHTSHLTLIEEAVYFRLINYYYDTEKPIPQETQMVIRRLRLTKYKSVVEQVLQEFFVLEETGWQHNRCDKELADYHNKAIRNKNVGKLGGRPSAKKPLKTKTDKTQMVSNENPTETQTTNYKLQTKNYINTPDGVALTLWSDFLTLRKAKKLPITQTALDGIAREAEKAGLTMAQAITVCCERGWGGFKADWLKAEAVAKEKESQAWRNDDVLMMQKARELGVNTTGKSRFEVIAAIDKKRGAV